METLKALNSGGLEALKHLNLEAADYPDRVVLNYSMIDSPKTDPVVRECRGLIVQKPITAQSQWKILARSFDRFFNLGECPPAQQKEERAYMHHPELILSEKLDGSLISVYHDGHTWVAATRGKAFAEGPTVTHRTFADVWRDAIGDTVERFKSMDRDFTYVFELVSPETRVVTPYKTTEAYLLMVREKLTGLEWSWNQVTAFAVANGFKVPQVYKFNTLDEIIESLNKLPALAEGYVGRLTLKNGYTWRIKVKNPRYLAVAHMRNNGVMSDARIAYLVMKNDEAEYLANFGEDRPRFDPFIVARSKALAHLESLKQYLCIESQKEFAMTVKDTPVAFILFQIRKGRAVEQILKDLTVDNCYKLLSSYIGK